jgi:hypothetical protein
MIICESLVYGYLITATPPANAAVAAVRAAIATRMYPVIRPQSTILPALTYQRVAATRVDGLTEPGRLVDVRLQIDAWAAGYGQVKELAANVRLALNGYAHGPRDGLRAMHFLVDQDLIDETTKTYRVSADYSIWVEED